MPEFSFGQIDAVLAELSRIASDKRPAFTSRLKHLQTQGIYDQEARPGRGRAAKFSFAQLMMMVLGVELLQTGFPPQIAAKLVSGSWGGLEHTVFAATYSDAEMDEWMEMPLGPETREWLWIISPEVLRDLSDDGIGEWDHMEALYAIPLEELMHQITEGHVGVWGERWRTLVLNGTRITKAAISIIEKAGYATAVQLRDSLMERKNEWLAEALDSDVFSAPGSLDQSKYKSVVKQAISAMENESRKARFNPSNQVAVRQARRVQALLKPHHVLRIQLEDFQDQDHIADVRAVTDLISWGVLFPEIEGDHITWKLSAIGSALQDLIANTQVPATAIDDSRREAQAEIDARVQERLARLLSIDPDYPEEEALIYAKEGGIIQSRADREGLRRRFRESAASHQHEQGTDDVDP